MSQKIQENLKKFIRVDSTDNSKLRINFDGLCQYLLTNENRAFSPRDLERALSSELKKLEGQELSPAAFEAIAKYIDLKTIWLQKNDIIEKNKRLEELKWVNEVKTPEERYERMAEIYRRRAKRDSSEDIP